MGRQTGRALWDRARQARTALDAALSDPQFAKRVDPARRGMIGFSAGGYTTLVLAGARPDFARLSAYCHAHPDDRGVCGDVGGTRSGRSTPTWQPMAVPRLKAIVLLDPLVVPFGPEGLAAVRMPVLLYRPEHDDVLRGEANASALAVGLPRPPVQVTVPGGHFVFLDPCPPVLATDAPGVCADAAGVDRAAIHRQIETEIAEFLHKHL